MPIGNCLIESIHVRLIGARSLQYGCRFWNGVECLIFMESRREDFTAAVVVNRENERKIPCLIFRSFIGSRRSVCLLLRSCRTETALISAGHWTFRDECLLSFVNHFIATRVMLVNFWTWSSCHGYQFIRDSSGSIERAKGSKCHRRFRFRSREQVRCRDDSHVLIEVSRFVDDDWWRCCNIENERTLNEWIIGREKDRELFCRYHGRISFVVDISQFAFSSKKEVRAIGEGFCFFFVCPSIHLS